MWWCCGKSSKDALGCKYQKHYSKEDEEDDEGGNHIDAEDIGKHDKNTRCHCCKEQGHEAKNCPRDPNFRTLIDINSEVKRISQAKVFKKVFNLVFILYIAPL